SKPFQSKNKGLVAETFDWDEEEVSDDEEETQVKVLMALADDKLSVGKNHACNGGWIDITMKKEQRLNLLSKYNKIVFELDKCRYDLLALKQAKLEALTESSSENDANDNPFVPASLDYDHERIPKSKDWVKRLNPDSKLPNFNTGRILVLKSETVNKASPSFEVMTLTYQDHSLRERSGLGRLKHTKPKTQESSNKNVSGHVTISDPEPVTSSVPTEFKTNDQESKIYELPKLVQILMDVKINSTQKPQEPISVSYSLSHLSQLTHSNKVRILNQMARTLSHQNQLDLNLFKNPSLNVSFTTIPIIQLMIAIGSFTA
ncbi:hypothetical protein Tco_1572742, partial [Tanacetum coccineum]